MERVVVTGAAGAIGKVLVASLAEIYYDVVGIDLLPKPYLPSNIQYIQGDIRSKPFCNEVFHRDDTIVHLAAISNVRQAIKEPELCWQTNVRGTEIIAEVAIEREAKHVIFASSREVYGNSSLPAQEDGPVQPVNIYGQSKLAAELFLHMAKKAYHIPCTILRLANVDTPGDTRRVLEKWRENARNKQDLLIYGDGRKRFVNFVSVMTVIQAMKLLITTGAQPELPIINIGSTHSLSLQEASEYVLQQTGTSVKILEVEGPKDEVDKFIPNLDRMKRLGITPTRYPILR